GLHMDQPSKPDDKSKDKTPRILSQTWYIIVLQLVIGLLMVWSWGQALHGISTHSILYSEFKDHLAKGEVVECVVGNDQITGTIKSKTVGKDAAPAPRPGPAEKTPTAEKPEGFTFSTTPIEDRDLIKQLEAAKVKFTGSRPSIFTEYLLAWILPIGAMLLLWMFLSRRI